MSSWTRIADEPWICTAAANFEAATLIADDLLEPVPVTTVERLSSWVGPVSFIVAAVVSVALCGPFAAAAVILGPWWADWRTP